MLRVLHCIYDDPGNPWVGGGGSLRVWELYRRLTDQVDATVATGSYPGASDEVVDGVRYRRLGAARPYAASRLTYARAASRLLRAGEYDVGVFDFSVYTPIRLPRRGPVGLVVHMLHGPTARERWGAVGGRLLAAVERTAIARAPAVCVTSEWLARQVRAIVPAATPVARAASGVSPEFFDVVRAEGDYLLYYGRFDLFQKGLDALLRAFAQLGADFPGVRLRIAGRGKDAERVREMARALGVAERTEVMEGVSRAEVLALFAGALAMLMPSRLEGLPMAPAEAMAAGVPVIASSVGAIPEVIASPAEGVLVPPDRPDALADAAAALLRSPERRAAMSLAARGAAERFRWERVARQHLDFLNLVAARRGPTRTGA